MNNFSSENREIPENSPMWHADGHGVNLLLSMTVRHRDGRSVRLHRQGNLPAGAVMRRTTQAWLALFPPIQRKLNP
jgi:hypothetical protein